MLTTDILTVNADYFIPGLDGIVARQLNQTSAFGAWVLKFLIFQF